MAALICDVDGVLLASPHERAWREAYQQFVAGKPRLDGARAALAALGFANAAQMAAEYAEQKQRRLEELISAGEFHVFPDAQRFVRRAREHGLRLAAASSSRNATGLLRRAGLLASFEVDVCGREVAHGKPAPDLFLLAARELGVPAVKCAVVEDAPAGIQAARAAGMSSIGVARLDDQALLLAAGADVVVRSLDQVPVEFLRQSSAPPLVLTQRLLPLT